MGMTAAERLMEATAAADRAIAEWRTKQAGARHAEVVMRQAVKALQEARDAAMTGEQP